VRDNIHAHDVCTAIMAYAEAPRPAAVYNLGGGRRNAISVIEAIARFEELLGESLETQYMEEPRRGDHICYISDLSRLRADYPSWKLSVSLDAILEELAGAGAPTLS
jgi:CDP-paratose 2-epimerase